MKQLDTKISASRLWARFGIAYFCLLAVFISIIYPILHKQERSDIEAVIENEHEKIDRFSNLIRRTLQEQVSDLFVISKLPILKVYLDSEDLSREYLEGYFKELGETYQRFDQIRFINTEGKEVLRVNVDSGKATLTGKGDLQDKSKRYYFQDAIQLNQGQIYISEPDLNIEHGQIEIPEKTVIRFATPLNNSNGDKAGILVLNYNADYLIDAFQDIYSHHNNTNAILMDSQGHKIFIRNNSKFSKNHVDHEPLTESIQNNWDTIIGRGYGTFSTDGGMVLYTSINPIDFEEHGNTAIRTDNIFTKDYPWHFIVYIPNGVLWGSSILHSNEGRIIVSIFALLMAIITYYAVARRMIKRKIMEHDIAVNRELNYLYEYAPCGYHTIDADGNVIKINQTELNWVKLKRDDVINKPFANLLTKSSAETLNSYLFNTGTELPENIEVEMLRSDGSTFYASMASTKFIDNDGAALIHSNIVNINERVKLERELEQQANTDYLTGVNNRRNFLENAESACRHAREQGNPLSVVMLDIDYFKKINDAYGHDAGDTVLKWFTSHIVDMLRSTDILARFGGEEFILLLPRTTLINACEIADRIRKKIMNSPISTDTGETINITVSLGVAEMHAHEDIDTLIKNADTALYESKNNGRNRVSSYRQRAA